jgi:hypothetical protein
MRNLLLLLFSLLSCYCFSQTVNDYKAVIVPLKYDFLRTENQYRLSTITKHNLLKAGFSAFYANEIFPFEYNEKCSLLYVNVEKINAFLITKLFVVFKDCFGKEVYKSEIGKSKEKDFDLAYTESLNQAFESIYKLNYKFSGTIVAPVVTALVPTNSAPVSAIVSTSESNSNLLYAQATATGYQLVDSSPKVVFKLNKTSTPTIYTAAKGNVQGVFIQKDNQWFFEFYENEKLVSEKVAVKF